MDLAKKLAESNWILRSGGAPGADSAFADGIKHLPNLKNYQEIYIPWNGFNGLKEDHENGIYLENNPMAEEIANKYHPVYGKLSQTAKKLMCRNGYQILGKDLKTPSKFIICWTRDGAIEKTNRDTGGTGQALRIAIANNIPIYNLNNKYHYQLLNTWLYD